MGTSLIRNTPLLGPYSRTIPRVLWWSLGGGGSFLWARYPCREEEDHASSSAVSTAAQERFRVEGVRFRIAGSGFRVSGLGFRV